MTEETSDWTDEEHAALAELQAGRAAVGHLRSQRYKRLRAWARSRRLLVGIQRWGRWCNPIPLDAVEGDREACMALYVRYLDGEAFVEELPEDFRGRAREFADRRATLLEELPSLRGKLLLCSCAPRACHGDELARRVNATEGA